MIKHTVGVITDDAEILRGVEEDAGSALIIAAPVLMGVASHVGLAVAEATTINRDGVVL